MEGKSDPSTSEEDLQSETSGSSRTTLRVGVGTCFGGEQMRGILGEAGKGRGLPAWLQGIGTAVSRTLRSRKAPALGVSVMNVVG